ncbi:lipopolysaccharide N-acetylglucosaminyltransferase [Tumebacillus algifaecis]|uniref:Lipopolysaccharide N-acetylglucosaminyltransferase n=1 Tax=Tumebacillus algifaecis TaxID=1214604 RepID=A0A223D197_9BACL|nr:glycosyltransferase family 4 protein [Tumebacillus algifaecis]ASS75144.1 lipopolysaccharide N-acetylglucosaminyltransferase [Tumebacillus algifaecis]
MKILMICTEKLPVPPVRGGAIQTYIAGIAPELAKHHDITILGITDPSLPDSERVDLIQFERVPGRLFDIYAEHVVRFLQDKSFDLIHIFNRPRLVGPVRQAAPNSRLVLSMHNDMFTREKLTEEEAETTIQEVERIVTVSNYVGRKIASLYPSVEPKLRTIYSGVDLNRYAVNSQSRTIREQLRAQHGLEGKKVVLFVGRLSPKKGADILVRSMQYVAQRHPDAALVIVGGKWFSDDSISDYVAYVRALASRSKVPVITTGYVPADQIHHWFFAGDLFVCPSQWEEPLARVHYEAMAANLPIITTARGGNPEVLRSDQNGLLVERPEDPELLGAQISKLLADNSMMRSMGQFGRGMVETHYGFERVIREILEVWQ